MSLQCEQASKQARKKDNSNVATNVDYGVASFCKLALVHRIAEIPPKDCCVLLKVKTLNMHGQANQHPSSPRASPKFPHGWSIMSGSPRNPCLIGWTLGGKMH